MTSVPLVSQYGTIESDLDGRNTGFFEKPTLHQYWINAGFFVINSTCFDHWTGESLEREVLPALQQGGLLYTYHHNGFFRSMDTHKDQQEIERLFDEGVVHGCVRLNPFEPHPTPGPTAPSRTSRRTSSDKMK